MHIKYQLDTPEFKALEYVGNEGAVIVYLYIASNALGDRVVYPLALQADAMYKVGEEKRTGSDIMYNGVTVNCMPGQHCKWRAALVLIDKL